MLGVGAGLSIAGRGIKRRRGAPVGTPLQITIGGVTYERVTIDGAFASLDGQPVYMQVS